MHSQKRFVCSFATHSFFIYALKYLFNLQHFTVVSLVINNPKNLTFIAYCSPTVGGLLFPLNFKLAGNKLISNVCYLIPGYDADKYYHTSL